MNTPMQKLKNQFDEFKSIVTIQGFKELNLNKSEPKKYTSRFYDESTTFEDRGVKNDFVKIFSIKFNAEKFYNIGFTFNYVDVAESVTVSLKLYNGYLKSKDYSVEEFKNKFLNVISDIKETNYERTVDIIKSSFELIPTQDVKNRKKSKI
jgi:hypothetical protein